MKIMFKIAIGLGIIGGGAVAFLLLGWKDRPERADELPDSPQVPGKTGYKRIDALLPKLQALSSSSGIPLGLMVGWIAKESGGKLSSLTSLDERGYFQLMPSESSSIGVDHQRLSTDSDYSLEAGPKIIAHYQSVINDLMDGVTSAGTSYYWRLVKLAHSMGSGQTKKVVNAAKDAGQAKSWDALEAFALDMSIRGPQPKKWFPFVDKVYDVGKPFGFGSESPSVVGTAVAMSKRARLIGLDVFATKERF